MANITEHLKKVLTAVYGRDVRNSYHDALKAINDETENTTARQQTVENRQDTLETKYETQIKNITDSNPSNVEIVDMRTNSKGETFDTAGKRLNNFDSQLEESQKYIEGYIDVKSLGAKGDGVTDDSQILQSIINEHKKIQFKNGTFYIEEALNIPDDREVKFENDAYIKTADGINGLIINNNVNLYNANIDFTNNTDDSKSAFVYNGVSSIDTGYNVNPYAKFNLHGNMFGFDISKLRTTPNPLMPDEYKYVSYIEFINIVNPRCYRPNKVFEIIKTDDTFTGWFNSNNILDGFFIEPTTLGVLSGSTNKLSFQIQAGLKEGNAALTVTGSKNMINILQQDVGNGNNMDKIIVLDYKSVGNIISVPSEITNYQSLIQDYGFKNIINGHGNNSNYAILPCVNVGYDNTVMCGNQDDCLANSDLNGIFKSADSEINQYWNALKIDNSVAHFSSSLNKEMSYVFNLEGKNIKFARILGVGFAGNTYCKYVKFEVTLSNGKVFTKEFTNINSKQTYVTCELSQFCYSNNSEIQTVKVIFNPMALGTTEVCIGRIFMSSELGGNSYIKQGGDTIYGDNDFKGANTFKYLLLVGDNNVKHKIKIDNDGKLYTTLV